MYIFIIENKVYYVVTYYLIFKLLHGMEIYKLKINKKITRTIFFYNNNNTIVVINSIIQCMNS